MDPAAALTEIFGFDEAYPIAALATSCGAGADAVAGSGCVEALARESDRRCPQLGLFHQAQVPMTQTWTRDGDVLLELKG